MTRKTKHPLEDVPPQALAEAIRLWVKHMARELARQDHRRGRKRPRRGREAKR